VIALLPLLATALLGGALNALAGGGTFLVFPALLFAGVASVEANATASFVLLPGTVASAWVYRDTVRDMPISFLAWMSAVSLAGSLAGSLLLLHTTNETFSRLVPWLLFAAAGIFSAATRLRTLRSSESGAQRTSLSALLAGQLVISAYGGYFGAGMGVLMLALYLAAANLNMHSASGVRTICAAFINTLAVIIFASRGALNYRYGVPMLVAGIAGGYLGAVGVKRLDARKARLGVLIYAWALTAYFMVRMALGRT
jgi:uncharacterized membrane protein YfcA